MANHFYVDGADTAHPGDPARPRRSGARTAGAILLWTAIVAAAGALVARVVRSITALPAVAGEPALVDAVYGRISETGQLPVDVGMRLTLLQLDGYATVSRAFGRHDGLLTSARELAVTGAVLLVGCLLVVLAKLRVRRTIVIGAVAALAVSAPVIAVLTPVGPGVLAAAWFALAAATLAVGLDRPKVWPVPIAALFSVFALLTAPPLVVVVLLGVAAWCAGVSRPAAPNPQPAGARLARWIAAATLAAGAVAVTLWLVRTGLLDAPMADAVLTDRQRLALLCCCGGAAFAGLLVRWLRSVAVATAAGVALSAGFWSGADVLLPALAAMSVALVAVALDEVIVAHGSGLTARRLGVLVGVLVVVAATAVSAVATVPTVRRDVHLALSRWVAEQVDPAIELSVPVGLWADVHRDLARSGRSEIRVTPAGPDVDPPGEPRVRVLAGAGGPPQNRLATFGDGQVTVSLAGATTAYFAPGERARPGAELAQNPRLVTSDAVRQALRRGQVDIRAMVTLAALCARQSVTVAETGKPEPERDTTLPDRELLVSAVDDEPATDPTISARLFDWAGSQLAPFAPERMDVSAEGVRFGWRLPTELPAVSR